MFVRMNKHSLQDRPRVKNAIFLNLTSVQFLWRRVFYSSTTSSLINFNFIFLKNNLSRKRYHYHEWRKNVSLPVINKEKTWQQQSLMMDDQITDRDEYDTNGS